MPMPKNLPDALARTLVVFLLALGGAPARAGPPTGPSPDRPADWVFRAGGVYTLEPDRLWAEAVVVGGGRILYVGDNGGAERWIGEGTQVVDLAGRMLLPGFHDAHMHPMAAGATQLRCPLGGLAWPDAIRAKLTECGQSLDEGEWLRAAGLDPDVLQGQGPGTALLDAVAGGRPALILAQRNQAAWLNTAALDTRGIDAATRDPVGGEIVRDPASGEPAGVLRGTAVFLAWPAASEHGESALREGLRLASWLANSLGITSASEASATAAHWAAYQAAEQAGEMTLRINASLRWDDRAGPEQLQRLQDLSAQAAGPYFRADSVKLFVDGDPLNRSASLLEPYVGTDSLGTSHYGDGLAALVTRLDAAGFQVHLHAYGDRAVRNGLDAIASAVARGPPRDRRHQLAHLALVHPNDLPRFAALGVTADIQPLWAWWDEEKPAECALLGPPRCARLLAYRDLFDTGARVVAGSDWISASMSPLYGIQVALTRRPPDGSGPAWIPQQRVTLEEMLRAYTIDGAWLAGQEALTGSIEVGKAADLVVLERNLFEVEPIAIKDVRVLLTLLDGKVVYRPARVQP
jgi:hypothetical protein